MADLSECKLKTPLGLSLLPGLVGGKDDGDLIDYLINTTRDPIEAIGILYRSLSALISYCVDGDLHELEVRDCGVVLEEMLKSAHERKKEFGVEGGMINRATVQ
jgi:hypothetical protein